jgi:ribosomal protein S18 acetylase RimI-like enzyme
MAATTSGRCSLPEGQQMDLLIRTATLADYDAVCEVIAEADALHREALPRVFREPDGPARTEQFIAEAIAAEDSALWVAVHQGRIIGLLHAKMRETADVPILVPRRYIVIDNLVVRREFRRRGVARGLMEMAHHWAREKGLAQIDLNVWEFNKEAIAFYESLGYAAVSRRMWKFLD